ncbi:arylamine N-acetyltransferase 2 [Parathielavia appendiculata]|uniref:Arylamine N-acetyltransferase 2 n=1 Tax=Parathielavia appendiculata TaxID=2587402 RepID=A0AAN6TV42_9PEZI|nr:arylamine N-acetyltransferase 2 [Parathielavia appendiculata]
MESAYTPSQVAEYLSYIGLPPSFQPSSNPTLNLDYLTALFTHHITAIPYDNLSIHYSPAHAIPLDPQSLFSKIVSARRGRGGYCMETSILFNHMLRALGFDAYLTGVRIRPRVDGVPQGESYTGWVHLVNIVTVPDSEVKYAVDVGFGGDGMTVPMPLVNGLVHHNSLGTQEIRFVREFIPNQRFRGEGAHKMWVYQVRNGKDKNWVSFFAFQDQFEFFEEDFGNLNWYTSQSPESHQTWTPLAIRFLRGVGEDGRARVVGKVMMVKGVIKRNLTGKTELVKACTTEEERVEALRELFGIHLTGEEVVSIRGRQAELVG